MNYSYRIDTENKDQAESVFAKYVIENYGFNALDEFIHSVVDAVLSVNDIDANMSLDDLAANAHKALVNV